MHRRASMIGAPVSSRPRSASVGHASTHRWQLPQRSSRYGRSYARGMSSRTAQEAVGARLRPYEHGVARLPADAGARRQLPLQNRAGVHVRPPAHRRQRLADPLLQLDQPRGEDVVVIQVPGVAGEDPAGGVLVGIGVRILHEVALRHHDRGARVRHAERGVAPPGHGVLAREVPHRPVPPLPHPGGVGVAMIAGAQRGDAHRVEPHLQGARADPLGERSGGKRRRHGPSYTKAPGRCRLTPLPRGRHVRSSRRAPICR
jgi:hypothetical protein